VIDRAPRTIAVLTTGRQDWGILRSTARAIATEPGLRLELLAGGMHLSERHGRTIELIRNDGFDPIPLEWAVDLPDGHEAPADAQSAGALAAIGAQLRRTTPAALVLAGDRFETAAAALAATVDLVPIVHLHGGEQTLGAIDDALRHAITKLAQLHLVSSDEHARRVIAMGEDPASVHVVGPPGLDNLARPDLPARAELEADLGHSLEPPVVLVTVQPETLATDPLAAATAAASAMAAVPATYVVTLPNADPAGDRVREIVETAAHAAGGLAVAALGERRYWGLLRLADAMLGNSSSGLIEAPAVRLPAVNVGDRQAGRSRGPNVIDVPAEAAAVAQALRRALDPATRAALPEPDPRLVDGRAGERVARIIAAWQPSIPPRKPPIPIEREGRGPS